MTVQGERWEQARELFEVARALPREQREGFLQEESADAELRGEVDALLRAHDALETGAGERFLDALDAPRAAALLASGDDGEDRPDPEGLAAGEMLGRYRIVCRLGRGGMGVVYLAHDERLDRPVALKLLPRQLSLDETARRRFEEEARATSALDHPHIATIYEIAETDDGRIFLAMARYEGETLRQNLERGPLSVAEAVGLAVQIAEGLAAAHARGIVHRDIKPANLMVTPAGVVKIVDFGIAKITGSVLTQTGATPGTVAYMSPEQARGERVDAQTDLWSLGVVLYEMLAGHRPFRAEHEQALVYAIRHDEPEPIRHARSDVPEALARIVERCLRKEPADRYPAAGALLTDLRGFAAAPTAAPARPLRRRAALQYGSSVAVAVLLLAGAVALWPGTHASDAAPEARAVSRVLAPTRLAVLPLANLGPGTEDDYIADGLTEELISRLSDLRDLRVIARSSVMRYKGTEKSAAEIGRELDVGAILEGSVRNVGDQLRIAVRLIDAHSEEHLWSATYDADVLDAQTVQGEIARRVAAELDLRMQAEMPRTPARGGTEHAEAYKLYLQGRYLLGNLDEESALKAREYFQQALERDPTFARAWSGVADSYARQAEVEALPASEAYPRARAAAERALEFDPALAEAHASLARALSLYFWEMEAAERHFRRAIDLDPSSSSAHWFYAEYLRNRGRFDEALVAVQKAQELDPLSPLPYAAKGIILYMARQYDQALDELQRLLRVAPAVTYAYFYIGLINLQKGDYEAALAALKTVDPEGKHPGALSVRGMIHATAGRQAEARQMLAMLTELDGGESATAFHRAAVHVHLGEHERALDLLEEAAEERTQLMQVIKLEPIFDPLHSEPRFQALLQRVGLEG